MCDCTRNTRRVIPLPWSLHAWATISLIDFTGSDGCAITIHALLLLRNRNQMLGGVA